MEKNLTTKVDRCSINDLLGLHVPTLQIFRGSQDNLHPIKNLKPESKDKKVGSMFRHADKKWKYERGLE